MPPFTTILQGHNSLQERKAKSLERLKRIQGEFSCDEFLNGRKDICIFSAGSLGRLDSGTKSDLDIFVTADGGAEGKIGRLEEIELFSSILRINRELGFPELSNDGEYLKVFDIQESKAQIGSPADDNENWFTVRMLLLLESRHLINPAAYTRHTKEILSVYFRDAEDHKPFNLDSSVERVGVCGFPGAGQGATTKNGCSMLRSCNAAMRPENRAIQPVAFSPNG